VAARNIEGKYQYEAQLNAFITLPYTKLAESLLQREDVFHYVSGAEIVVAGNDSQKFAEVFHTETRRPMQNGMLNPEEPLALAVVRRIIARLVGRAATQGQKVLFSVPAQPIDRSGSLAYHQASLRQSLTELGYDASPLDEGLAVVFGELADSNYTGIGISCGSGLSNVCLAVLSVPVSSFSLPRSGDFIDNQAALATGEGATRVRVVKEESFHFQGLSDDRVLSAISVYYEEMLENLVGVMSAQISSARRLPKLAQPIPLAISGGTAMPKGFLENFQKALRAKPLPIQLSEVRLSTDPLNSTARGALMAAMC
jgi:hypothetical protein